MANSVLLTVVFCIATVSAGSRPPSHPAAAGGFPEAAFNAPSFAGPPPQFAPLPPPQVPAPQPPVLTYKKCLPPNDTTIDELVQRQRLAEGCYLLFNSIDILAVNHPKPKLPPPTNDPKADAAQPPPQPSIEEAQAALRNITTKQICPRFNAVAGKLLKTRGPIAEVCCDVACLCQEAAAASEEEAAGVCGGQVALSLVPHPGSRAQAPLNQREHPQPQEGENQNEGNLPDETVQTFFF